MPLDHCSRKRMEHRAQSELKLKARQPDNTAGQVGDCRPSRQREAACAEKVGSLRLVWALEWALVWALVWARVWAPVWRLVWALVAPCVGPCVAPCVGPCCALCGLLCAPLCGPLCAPLCGRLVWAPLCEPSCGRLVWAPLCGPVCEPSCGALCEPSCGALCGPLCGPVCGPVCGRLVWAQPRTDSSLASVCAHRAQNRPCDLTVLTDQELAARGLRAEHHAAVPPAVH